MVECGSSQLKTWGSPFSAVKKASAFGLGRFLKLRMECYSGLIIYII